MSTFRRVVRTRALVALVAALVLPASACGSSDDDGFRATATVAADHPVALVAEPDGSVLYAERLSGDVRRLGADDTPDPDPVAHVDTVGSESDQRGLVGLARASGGELYATWVRADDRRLVVGRIDGDEPVVIWEGPASSDLANGGTLLVAPDGRLVVGIGDLQQDRALADDPTVANRKVLSLDPAGPPSQTPEVLSTGWNNPFALAYDDEGVLWVADNSPGDQPERIGRGDAPAEEATDLPTDEGEAAPSALVALGGGHLGRCGFLTGRLDAVDVRDGTPRLEGLVVAEPCRTGAALRSDGRIVTAADDQLIVFG